MRTIQDELVKIHTMRSGPKAGFYGNTAQWIADHKDLGSITSYPFDMTTSAVARLIKHFYGVQQVTASAINNLVSHRGLPCFQTNTGRFRFNKELTLKWCSENYMTAHFGKKRSARQPKVTEPIKQIRPVKRKYRVRKDSTDYYINLAALASELAAINQKLDKVLQQRTDQQGLMSRLFNRR